MTELGAQPGARGGGRPESQSAALSARLRAAAGIWRGNRDVLASAASLIATTGVAAGLGFAYWAVAARLFSQRSVGYGSAAISVMTLLGTIGMLGLGTVLIAELPRRSARAGLIAAALLASGAGSLALGLGFVFLAPLLGGHFPEIYGTVSQGLLFVAGVVLTGVTLVFDQATIGLYRSGLQLWRNVLFSIVKLIALVGTAFVLHDEFGAGIMLSWVAGLVASVLPVALQLKLSGTPVLRRPDWGVLRGLGRTAAYHNWLNISAQLPRLLIPVLVTIVVSPAANAAFYAAWTICGFLYIVPTHLATALFAVAAGDAQAMARKLRLTLRLSALAGIPGVVILGAASRQLLAVFGASYASAGSAPLVMLAIGYLPVTVKFHYIAVSRATGRLRRAAVVLTAAAALELAAAAAAGASAGLRGLSLALLAVFGVEGLVTAPMVARAALGRGRHRRASPAAAGSQERAEHQPDHRGYPGRPSHSGPAAAQRRARQEEGLAVLLSLAQSAASTNTFPVVDVGTGELPRFRSSRDARRGSRAQEAPAGRPPK